MSAGSYPVLVDVVIANLAVPTLIIRLAFLLRDLLPALAYPMYD